MGLLIRWLAPFVAILIAAALFPNAIAIPGGYAAAAVFALVLAILNAVIKPVLELLTLPITCLTLGLFHFVLNAIIFALAAWLVPGVTVNGFLAAFVGALVVSLVGTAASALAR